MSRERLVAAVVLAASGVTLGGAFLFEYVGGLAPCVLCLLERYPYWAALALSALALALRDAKRASALLALCGVAFVIGTGIGVFHVGVEQHWWEGTAACTASAMTTATGSLEALRQQLLETPVARCDRIPWSLFGLSLAGYNVLISLGLAAASLLTAVRAWRTETP